MAIQLNQMEKLREEFPILKRLIKGKPLVYLDNAATTQKPEVVIETMNRFYREHNSNVHRGVHTLSEESTILYDEAHRIVSNFINAEFEEVIFTKGTTEGLNLLAYTLTKNLKKGDEIVLTQMEHHSRFFTFMYSLCINIKILFFITIKNSPTFSICAFSI